MNSGRKKKKKTLNNQLYKRCYYEHTKNAIP